ncbi:ribonuclease H-like domain-containing protein [Tanacetum coccineum]|uniref:Ribonuclease H-like domain-containing protein n=1 Tax=Tanacetum coccineum TaxID=301880 RepID=A0ABQ5EKV8_9ASTR
MDRDSVHMVAASKVPMLKPGEYELWRMRMEQYIQMIDYSLWEVIENGNAPPITKIVKGVETTIAPATAEEKAQRRLELKARRTLLMRISTEHQLKFNSIKDAKSLLQPVEKSSEVLDQTFDRLQKLISQLEIHGETISQEDVNKKFLRSLSPEWNTHTIVSSSTNGAVNTAHGATASTQATAVNSTTIDNLSDAVICAFFANGYANNGGKEILKEHWKEVFCEWALRNQENRNRENTRRVVPVETTTSNALMSCNGSGYDWSDQAEEGPTNFALMAYSSTSSNSKIHLREVAITELRRKLELAQKQKDEIQLTVENFENSSKNLSKLIDCQIVDKCKTSLGYNVVPPPYTGNFMPPKPDLSFSGLEEFMNEPIVSEHTVKKPVVETSEAKASADKPKVVRKNFGLPIIEDWVSDSEEENVSQTKIEKKTAKPSFVKIDFVKTKQTNKTNRKTAKQVEHNRQNTHIPRGNQRNWNNMMSQRLGSNFEMFNKACYVCGSFDHLQVDCKKVNQKQFQNTKPVWNYAKRVNHQNFAKKTHPCPKKNMVPRAVTMKSGLVFILIMARQVANTAHPKITVNSARPMTNLSKSAHSTVKWPIHKNTTFKNSNFNQRVNTVKDKNVNTIRPKAVVNVVRPKVIVNAVKGNNVNAVKASACWVWKPKIVVLRLFPNTIVESHEFKRFDYIDAQGRSKHMTGNMSYLNDFEEIDGGYVAFGGNPKVGKIIGKSLDQRVKVIRCDSGTEFKNKEMNQFCKTKGIKREFSVARTPQQNGVAERKNRIN